MVATKARGNVMWGIRDPSVRRWRRKGKEGSVVVEVASVERSGRAEGEQGWHTQGDWERVAGRVEGGSARREMDKTVIRRHSRWGLERHREGSRRRWRRNREREVWGPPVGMEHCLRVRSTCRSGTLFIRGFFLCWPSVAQSAAKRIQATWRKEFWRSWTGFHYIE
jgi:hypothetical protein